ncbi:MAG: WD40 repeat domain-containing serine/threonine protein kinase, partial [Isosphaeraceae bacterium]
MNSEDASSLDEKLLAALVEWDQAILDRTDRAAGTDSTLPQGSAFPTPDGGEAGSLTECIDLLEEVWPRGDMDQGVGGLPRRIGRFEILGELGRGGFGIVYRAYDPTLGRTLALKVPHAAALVNPDLERRFLREARAAGGLDHPNIATVFEAGRAGPFCYIASALCEGPNLSAWLRRREGPAPLRLASAIVSRLADAVQQAHDRGILHRDLKPSNVLLWPEAASSSASAALGLNFVPKLTDFGLARIVEEAGDETRTGTPIGSPSYMAPEQAAGRNREVGPASDVYGLGAILYELLTGRPPFRGESNVETIWMVLDQEVVPPRSLRSGLPRDLGTICLTCLEKEPRKRYASAAALADDLRRYLEGRPILARRPSLFGRAWRAARRHPSRAVALAMTALMALVIIVGVSFYTARLRTERDHADQSAEKALRSAIEADRERLAADAERRLTERHLYASNLREAQEAIQHGEVEHAQEVLPTTTNAVDRDSLQEFPRRYLANLARRNVEVLRGHGQLVSALFPLPGGRLLSTDDKGGAITWDLNQRRELQRTSLPPSVRNANALMFGGPGLLAVMDQPAMSDPPFTSLGWYDLTSGQRVGEILTHEGTNFRYARVLADGTVLGIMERQSDGLSMFRLFSVKSGTAAGIEPIAEVGPNQLAGASPGGDYFVTCAEGRLRRHDAGTGAVVHEAPFDLNQHPGSRLDASPDGRLAVISQRTGPALVVETESGEIVGEIPTTAGINSTVFAPNDKALVVIEVGGRTHLWDRPKGSGRSRLIVEGDAGVSPRRIEAAFSPDGRLAVISQRTGP